MNRSFALALALTLTACSGSAEASGETPKLPVAQPAGDRVGTVHAITKDIWAVDPDDQPNQRLCFEGPLAIALRIEGQKVRFSGTAGEIKPNERRACTPFTLAGARAG